MTGVILWKIACLQTITGRHKGYFAEVLSCF